MLKANRCGEITQIMMGREMDGAVLYWTAAYLVDGLLIDTGCAFTAEELIRFLREHEVKQVVNTHHHEDHVGANYLIQRELGLDIFAPAPAVPLIGRRLPLRQYQEMVWGYPEPTAVRPLPAAIDTTRCHFELIETPGHSADHVALFEPEKGWCFTGDLFVSENLKMLRADEDMGGIISSLEKLLELPADDLILYTAIGRIFTEGKRAIRNFLSRMSALRDEVARLAGQSLSAPEIRDRIFGRETQLASLTGGHFSVLNLVEQLIPKK
jgi:glyoxylase-like metal-dependent hydrolase (beta-lactamase superfamily II)